MAVEDKYVNAKVAAGKHVNPAYNGGAPVVTVVYEGRTNPGGDTQSNNSIYRVIRGLDPDFIIVDGRCWLSGGIGTTYNIGLWEMIRQEGVATSGMGPAIDESLFDLVWGAAGGVGRGSQTGHANEVFPFDLPIEDVQKPIYQLAGHTLANRKAGYDLAFQSAGSTSANLRLNGWISFIKM